MATSSTFRLPTPRSPAYQIAEDEAEARADAHIRRLRVRTGLSRPALAERQDVSVEILRNREQGKRFPRGPARALLRIIGKTLRQRILQAARRIPLVTKLSL